MKKYDEVYYIAKKPFGENQLYIKADLKTAERGYHYKKVPLGEAPFFFQNSYKEEDKKKGNKWALTEVLLVGSNLLVCDKIRDELKTYEIEGMQLYPSVYIDDENNWHENYWFLNFYEDFYYLDKNQSIVDIDEDDDEDDDIEVFKYSLDVQKLNQIPEERRLLFKMGGATDAYIFVHQKIVDFIINNNFKGVRFFKVSEFEEGDQYSKSAIEKAIEVKS